MKKSEPHIHQELPPIKAQDGINYVIKCAICPREIKITAKQFAQGGYEESQFKE